MNLPDAVRSVLTQYATFTGRARRSELWYFVLASCLVLVVTTVLDLAIGTSDTFGSTGLISGLLSLALFIPSLAVQVRRLHDTDRSGWWWFVGLVPVVGGIALLVFCCQDSKPDNRYGRNPKAVQYAR